ncbi:Hpt domain-containing protein [Roseovarius aquimarinus]|uniref:histidine kinase n=1 Tax=Roseovarius aquimarinus TaxID=1229156 RepID=A0ABW7I5B0_9RHOB
MTDEMDEIWALYADDGAQALDAMEEELEKLADGAGDAGAGVGALFRAVHTFKGNSRVLGLGTVEGLAHLAEDLIGLVRDEGAELTPEIVEILVRTGDALRGMLEETADTRSDVDPGPSEPLKDDLRALIGRITSPEAEAAAGDSAAEAEDTAPQEDEPDAPVESPAKPAPKAPMFDPALAGLLDQLDGGDGANFDDFEDDDFDDVDPVAEEETEEAPAAEDAPSAASAPEPAEDAAPGPVQTIAEITDGKLREADPLYRQIFADMAEKCIAALGAEIADWQDESPAKTRKEADGLRYAAGQMDLPDWCAPLDDFLADSAPDAGAAGSLRDALSALLARDTGGADEASGDAAPQPEEEAEQEPEIAPEAEAAPAPEPEAEVAAAVASEEKPAPKAKPAPKPAPKSAPKPKPAPVAEDPAPAASAPSTAEDRAADLPEGAAFFAEMAALYPEIAAQGMQVAAGTPPKPEAREALFQRITALARPHGYVRLIDAAEHLSQVEKGKGHRAAELAFYEELVTIERSVPAAIFGEDVMAPSRMLGAWCADHVFDTLGALRRGLEPAGAGKEWFPEFETLMRRVHFACLNYSMHPASQLTMSLIDLFARVRGDGGAGPDVILVQMGRGYVDTMELVFDALAQGDEPDLTRIETLFEDAANVCFIASGVVTAKSIETRLGLPPEFHRVLSPESVKAAHDAIGAGLNFFVLRADLNDDDALAQDFFDWITTGQVRMITNVTVFDGDRTLFDFLVASPLDADGMAERAALMDPSGARLSLALTLTVREAEPEPPAEAEADASELALSDAGDESPALLEAVGAISAGHALLEHELSRLASVDLMQDITDALRAAGVPPLDPRVRSVLHGKLDEHALRLQEISEAGAQLTTELSHLQQQSVAQRSRPAEVLLRPLQAYVATRSGGGELGARVTYVGGDIVLDRVLIEDLRGLLKALVNMRLAAPDAPTRFHVSIETDSDHVRVDVTDNGPTRSAPAELEAIAAPLRRRKGALREAVLPAGAGMRFHLRVPQNMIVLDGMVVRVGRVRYVLPIDAIQRILQTDNILPVTASGHTRMLNMGEDGLVPIHPLVPGSLGKEKAPRLFVIVQGAGRRIAIPVDELLGQQLVMLRPLEGVLSDMRDMSGIAILSGGEVGMIVSVGALAAQGKEEAWAS